MQAEAVVMLAEASLVACMALPTNSVKAKAVRELADTAT